MFKFLTLLLGLSKYKYKSIEQAELSDSNKKRMLDKQVCPCCSSYAKLLSSDNLLIVCEECTMQYKLSGTLAKELGKKLK